MRRQVKFVFQIGYPKRHARFEQALAFAATHFCGGCTTSSKQGWWAEDGATHADRFFGKVQQEHCFEIELTCEDHKAHDVYTSMQDVITDAAGIWGIDTDWVHVTETEMRGRHFSVAALNVKVQQERHVAQVCQ